MALGAQIWCCQIETVLCSTCSTLSHCISVIPLLEIYSAYGRNSESRRSRRAAWYCPSVTNQSNSERWAVSTVSGAFSPVPGLVAVGR